MGFLLLCWGVVALDKNKAIFLIYLLDKPSVFSYSASMFIREVKKANGHVSIRVVRSRREGKKVRQETIGCVGHCHQNDKEKIALFYKIGRKVIQDLKGKDQFSLFEEDSKRDSKGDSTREKKRDFYPGDMVHAPSLKEESRQVVGISDIFGKVYDDLGLSSCFNEGYKHREASQLLKEMVLHRLKSPMSKRGSVLDISRRSAGVQSIPLDRVYRMMDKVYKNSEVLKGKLTERTLSLFKERIDVVFFDVTTLYFESFIEDNLRSCGFSKDNKIKETQVVLSLMTTKGGLPIGYELFSGNTFEGNTLLQTIDNISKSYDIRDVFLVADRGMFSKKNLFEMDKRKVQFIAGARLKSMKKSLKDRVLSEAPAFSKRGDFRKVRSWTGEYEWEGFRLIVRYDRERADKDRRDREKLLAKIKEKMKGGRVRVKDLVKNTGLKKYLELKQKGWAVLNEDKIQAERLWDGFSAVAVNNKKETAHNILEKYKNLWQIESAFRMNKHDLKMRPIYHWTPRRIKAHVLICFIAYGLTVFVRHVLKSKNINLSFEVIKQELSLVQISYIEDTSTGKKFFLPSTINKTQKNIYKAFNKTFPRTIKFMS